jgi:hypothetical protein
LQRSRLGTLQAPMGTGTKEEKYPPRSRQFVREKDAAMTPALPRDSRCSSQGSGGSRERPRACGRWPAAGFIQAGAGVSPSTDYPGNSVCWQASGPSVRGACLVRWCSMRRLGGTVPTAPAEGFDGSPPRRLQALTLAFLASYFSLLYVTLTGVMAYWLLSIAYSPTFTKAFGVLVVAGQNG